MATSSPPKFALIIGGTGFISQYCVEELHSAGFVVATMNRGSSFDLHQDKVSHRFIVNCRKRKEFVASLKDSITTMKDKGFSMGNAWDLVIDFICYEPPHAQDCCSGLNGICKLFVMISTDSIYEVCTRPSYLDLKETDLCDAHTPLPCNTDHQQSPLGSQHHITRHPGRREEDQTLLPISDKELCRKDEYGLEKLQCEQVFLETALKSITNNADFNTNQIQYPFETVWLRLPDVTGERELPRNRHFQLQMRIQLGLPIYIDPESNHYDVDGMNLPTYYDPESHDSVINRLPEPSTFPPKAAKLSFVHARDVSTAILACHRLQQLASTESVLANTTKMSDDSETVILDNIDKNDHNGSFTASWSQVVNSGINIGSLEQVTLLEYLYLIGNTLRKPVFVYGSHNGREQLLKQRIKATTHQHGQQLQSPAINLNTRIYPKSYHQLYLEYYTTHFDSLGNPIETAAATSPASPSPGREENRPNLQFFHSTYNNTPPTPKAIDTSAVSKLDHIQIDQVVPALTKLARITNTCHVCTTYLPTPITSDPSSPVSPVPSVAWVSHWNQNETPSEFLRQLLQAGYTCPLSSTSDSSESSSSSSDSDDSDYDDFFSGTFAKSVVGDVQKVNAKLSRKAQIALVVKKTLAKPSPLPTTQDTMANQRDFITNDDANTIRFDQANLEHLKVLHLLERLETSDQCSYLPSVTQGPISIQKAMDHLPGWTPTCLYAWATKQTLWYSSTSTFMECMDADPRNTLWGLDQKWRNHLSSQK